MHQGLQTGHQVEREAICGGHPQRLVWLMDVGGDSKPSPNSISLHSLRSAPNLSYILELNSKIKQRFTRLLRMEEFCEYLADRNVRRNVHNLAH